MPWEFTEEERKERLEKYGKLYPLGHWVLPIKMKGNAYFGGSVASAHEPEAKVYAEEGITFEFSEEMDKVYVSISNVELLEQAGAELLSADTLGKSYHAEMAWENPDGTNIVFDTDFFGRKRPTGNVTPGPFEIFGMQSEEKFEL